ncbi:MAG: hypothetical protein K2I20_00615, partial [Clostridia bacterium]|nr:hypothetical protein [Clostridia bacterium]
FLNRGKHCSRNLLASLRFRISVTGSRKRFFAFAQNDARAFPFVMLSKRSAPKHLFAQKSRNICKKL